MRIIECPQKKCGYTAVLYGPKIWTLIGWYCHKGVMKFDHKFGLTHGR